MFCSQPYYDYISDYECIFNHPIDEDVEKLYINVNQERWVNLQAAKRRRTNVPITHLAHFTQPAVADEIIKTGGFKGGLKKINEDGQGQDIKAKFSWWSPKFSEDDIEQVRDHNGEAIKPFFHQHRDDNDDQIGDQDTVELILLKNQFATSDAFKPNTRRYGSSYFQYGIGDLCKQYGKHFKTEVQFKILGTFGDKQEVMHAVLVCSQVNAAGPLFEGCPPVLTPEEDVNNEAVVTRDSHGNWVWKPQVTGSTIVRLRGQNRKPMYRRWEHVAFAFHIPEEMEKESMEAQVVAVDDLKSHLKKLPNYQ